METNSDLHPPQPTLRHSAIGIAAFIVGLLSVCILVSYLGFLFVVLSTLDSSDLSLYNKIPTILIYVLCSTSLLSLIALVLGVIPLFRKDRKKLFAILALVEWLIAVILIVISFFTFFIFTS